MCYLVSSRWAKCGRPIARGGSFLLLPGWHVFCLWRLWINCHIPPSLLQDPWPCIQLVETVKLGHWPRPTWSACRAIFRQICSIKPEDVATVRSSEDRQRLSLRTSFWEREGLAGLSTWSNLVMQSEQHVIYRFMAGWGWGGRGPKLTLKKLTEKDCHRQLTLKKGTTETCYACSWTVTRKGAHWCPDTLMPLHLHINQKSDYDDDDDTQPTGHRLRAFF